MKARQRLSVKSIWLLLTVWSSKTTADSCAPYPIALPITNITLSTGNTARGINASVGTPQQPLAWLLDVNANNSWVYGTSNLCNGFTSTSDWSEIACITWRGGQYLASDSSTVRTLSAGDYPVDSRPPNVSYAADVLTLNANVSLDDIPIGTVLYDWNEQGYESMMILGVGPNSTIMRSLTADKKIASDSFGFFWGETGGTANVQSDGQLVLGGYDKAKTRGDGLTLPLRVTEKCETGLLVTVSQMALAFVNGTTASIMEPNDVGAFECCLTPHWPVLMRIPWDVFFAFNDYTNMTNDSNNPGRTIGYNFWGLRYTDGFRPYNGDLTLELNHEFTVTIPNNQLVVPDIYVDQDTGAIRANSTDPDLIWDPIWPDGPLQIGRQFFGQTYLYVNRDAGEFTLWLANPTPNEELVATDTSGKVITDFCSTETGSSGTPTSTSTSSGSSSGPNGDDGGGGGLSGGAIAGIVVGSVAVVGLVALIALYLLRRRKTATTPAQTWAEQPQQNYHGAYAPTHQPGTIYEKPGDNVVPQFPPQQHEIYEAPTEVYDRPIQRAEM